MISTYLVLSNNVHQAVKLAQLLESGAGVFDFLNLGI